MIGDGIGIGEKIGGGEGAEGEREGVVWEELHLGESQLEGLETERDRVRNSNPKSLGLELNGDSYEKIQVEKFRVEKFELEKSLLETTPLQNPTCPTLPRPTPNRKPLPLLDAIDHKKSQPSNSQLENSHRDKSSRNTPLLQRPAHLSSSLYLQAFRPTTPFKGPKPTTPIHRPQSTTPLKDQLLSPSIHLHNASPPQDSSPCPSLNIQRSLYPNPSVKAPSRPIPSFKAPSRPTPSLKVPLRPTPSVKVPSRLSPLRARPSSSKQFQARPSDYLSAGELYALLPFEDPDFSATLYKSPLLSPSKNPTRASLQKLSLRLLRPRPTNPTNPVSCLRPLPSDPPRLAPTPNLRRREATMQSFSTSKFPPLLVPPRPTLTPPAPTITPNLSAFLATSEALHMGEEDRLARVIRSTNAKEELEGLEKTIEELRTQPEEPTPDHLKNNLGGLRKEFQAASLRAEELRKEIIADTTKLRDAQRIRFSRLLSPEFQLDKEPQNPPVNEYLPFGLVRDLLEVLSGLGTRPLSELEEGLARLGPSLAGQATLELQPGLSDLLSRTEEELCALGSKQIIFEAQIARAENLSKRIVAAELEIGLQEKQQLVLEKEEKVKAHHSKLFEKHIAELLGHSEGKQVDFLASEETPLSYGNTGLLMSIEVLETRAEHLQEMIDSDLRFALDSSKSSSKLLERLKVSAKTLDSELRQAAKDLEAKQTIAPSGSEQLCLSEIYQKILEKILFFSEAISSEEKIDSIYLLSCAHEVLSGFRRIEEKSKSFNMGKSSNKFYSKIYAQPQIERIEQKILRLKERSSSFRAPTFPPRSIETEGSVREKDNPVEISDLLPILSIRLGRDSNVCREKECVEFLKKGFQVHRLTSPANSSSFELAELCELGHSGKARENYLRRWFVCEILSFDPFSDEIIFRSPRKILKSLGLKRAKAQLLGVSRETRTAIELSDISRSEPVGVRNPKAIDLLRNCEFYLLTLKAGVEVTILVEGLEKLLALVLFVEKKWPGLAGRAV